MAEKVSPPAPAPAYNHTRSDSPLTPCWQCRAMQRRIAREVTEATAGRVTVIEEVPSALSAPAVPATGRRRCTIREHRRQLKAMQRVVATLRAQQAEAWALLRVAELERDDWRRKYWAAHSARPWWTRWFGIP